MPELPEVEVCRLGLLGHLQNSQVSQVITRIKKLRQPLPPDLASCLQGKTITTISRRGKYLLLHCKSDNADESGYLLIHLGMSGSLRLMEEGAFVAVQKHDHVDFSLSNQTHRTLLLRYTDPRRFGLILWLKNDEYQSYPLLSSLGIEPLSSDFDGKALYKLCQKRKTAIKLLLMDTKIIVGIGNIYVAEALFRTGISPLCEARALTPHHCERLAQSICTTLHDAIAAGGSSIRNYIHTDGKTGSFQLNYAVYGRQGLPCSQCKTPISKISQQGRSTFYCAKCQPFIAYCQ